MMSSRIQSTGIESNTIASISLPVNSHVHHSGHHRRRDAHLTDVNLPPHRSSSHFNPELYLSSHTRSRCVIPCDILT